MLFPLDKATRVKHNYWCVTVITWCRVKAHQHILGTQCTKLRWSALCVLCRSLWRYSGRAEINVETTWQCGSCGGGSKTRTGSREEWCQGGPSYH